MIDCICRMSDKSVCGMSDKNVCGMSKWVIDVTFCGMTQELLIT